MVTRLKNKFLSNSQLLNFLEKKSLILIICIILFSILCLGNITSIHNSVKWIKSEKQIINNLEMDLDKIKNNHDTNILSKINYDSWLTTCAIPSNIFIYKNTNNLKLLLNKPQNELDTFSKNFKIINGEKNYGRIVKFIVINKKKKTFITNDIESINHIKTNLLNFSKENGELFNYISSKGKWYHLSYDSYSAPANNNFEGGPIPNPYDFVEAYWFPKNYEYSKEDLALLKDSLNAEQNILSQEINNKIKHISLRNNDIISNIIFLIIYLIAVIILVFFMYCLGKKRILAGLKYSLIVRSVLSIKYWFENKKTFFKINTYVLYILLTLLITATIFLSNIKNEYLILFSLPFIILFLLFPLPKMIKFSRYLDEIIDGSNKITSGNLNHLIDEKGDIRLSTLAHNINKINKGFKVSIEDQIKNEKLKSQLVTNVSHDLKTPLTSIINSTDILLREDISQEEREEYLKTLHRKSLKLKKLIDDLFQISKINSGKVELNKSNIDVVELLNQSIAEYSDTEIYNNKNLNFIVRPFKDNINMNLDGNKMSRVFENIINNALKYSMKNTRVYVDIENLQNGIKISFKNISITPLDFDKEDIFERFTRGDKSRNSKTDGHGLGLAIAKSIVELHAGKMYIDFDGDLFKSIIELYY